MQENFQIKKALEWLLPSEFKIVDEYRIYAPRERTDLSATIDESHIIEPFTAIRVAGGTILINGFDRHRQVIEKNLNSLKIPTWVITEELSDKQIKKLILDLSRYKKKTYQDQLVEYRLYDELIPNEQGKRLGGHNRHKLIANLIGISPSQLSTLLRIDNVRPSLITEVDNQHRTLSDAQQKAKEIKQAVKKKDNEHKHSVAAVGKPINVTQTSFDVCPTCNRPLSDIQPEELPGIFNYKRPEDDNHTEWMAPLTSASVEQIAAQIDSITQNKTSDEPRQ